MIETCNVVAVADAADDDDDSDDDEHSYYYDYYHIMAYDVHFS